MDRYVLLLSSISFCLSALVAKVAITHADPVTCML